MPFNEVIPMTRSTNQVFWISTVILLLTITLLGMNDPVHAKKAVDAVKWSIINKYDDLFMWGTNLSVLFCIGLACSKFGKVKLGSGATQFSTISWLSMIFACGMGVGLVFWGVAEPVAYYTGWFKTPLDVTAGTHEALNASMGAVMTHWGIHPWSLYGVVGIALAYSVYVKGNSLKISAALRPIFGNQSDGVLGKLVDTLAVLATISGLATSLGLGAKQIAQGFTYLLGTGDGIGVQIVIILCITIITAISALSGVAKGIKWLSNLNLVLAIGLLAILVAIYPALALAPIKYAVEYVQYVLPLSNTVGRPDTEWMNGWTIFYLSWWASWAPFVGVFIAKISKGRTIRELVVALLVVPLILTLLWMGIMGQLALDQVVAKVGELGTKGITDVGAATYQMIGAIPGSTWINALVLFLVVLFFVTGADSGSLVMDTLTTKDGIESSTAVKGYWAVLQGALASILLYLGGSNGMEALQAGSVSTGLPFMIVIILMIVALSKDLYQNRNNLTYS